LKLLNVRQTGSFLSTLELTDPGELLISAMEQVRDIKNSKDLEQEIATVAEEVASASGRAFRRRAFRRRALCSDGRRRIRLDQLYRSLLTVNGMPTGWREGAAHQFFGPANVPHVWRVLWFFLALASRILFYFGPFRFKFCVAGFFIESVWSAVSDLPMITNRR
jgi:hypothetical protein